MFTRTHRTVPVDRIHQVDVVADLRHRLFGVAEVRIDTAAGGSAAEARLSVLSRRDAEELRRTLLTGDMPPTTAPCTTDEAVVGIGYGRLALAGVTGPQMVVMVALFASATQWLDDIPAGWREKFHPDQLVPRGAVSFALGLSALAVLWLAFAAVSSIVVDGGFVLSRREDGTLHLRRGLLDRRETTLGIRRAQAVLIEQSFVRRLLGIASVRVQSAGTPSGRAKAVSRIMVPILPVADVDRVLQAVLPEMGPVPPLLPAPPAARRRAVLRRVGPTVAVAATTTVLLWPMGVLAFAAVPVAVIAGELAYRGLGHVAWDGFVAARSGGLFRSTVVVPVAKVQSYALSSSPFQRSAGLATLRLHVAGRGPTPAVVDGDATRLASLTALVSPAAMSDEADVRTQVQAVGPDPGPRAPTSASMSASLL